MIDADTFHGQAHALVPAESTPQLPAMPDRADPFGKPIVVPKLVADAGNRAAKRYANFFGSIANDNTRAAYQATPKNW